MSGYRYVRIDFRQTFLGGNGLREPQFGIALGIKLLPVQVAEFHVVPVDDCQLADPCPGQCFRIAGA